VNDRPRAWRTTQACPRNLPSLRAIDRLFVEPNLMVLFILLRCAHPREYGPDDGYCALTVLWVAATY
jgi:hypothetical protein